MLGDARASAEIAGRTTVSASLLHSLPLWACASLHTVNDTFFAVIFPLLPLLADELNLSYAESGLIKTVFSTASSLFQVPVGLLAERWAEYGLLVAGNAWVAAGLIGMGLAVSFPALLGLTTLAGLGGNTQHPLAASIVSRSAPEGRRATAVGMLNFAGDLGKMVAPPLVALVAIPFGWRTALIGLGVVGLVFSFIVWRLPVEQAVPKAAPKPRDPESTEPDTGGGWGITRPVRFSCLSLLGFIDSSTRGAALAFLPFVLVDKGLDPTGVAWLFSLLFVGGALGKFGCGRLGDRFGATFLIVATELVTVVALVLFPGAPLLLVPVLAIAFGFVLNGTSSVLYAAVADFVAEHRRARGYGLYYTLVNGASAIAPFLYGLLGDRQGLTVLFFTMAAVNALTVPLALALRPSQSSPASGH